MSWVRSLLLIASGVVLGVCFTVGLLYGVVRGYIALPPEVAERGLRSIIFGSSVAPSGEDALNLPLIRETVQDILSSAEARALVEEILTSASPETLAGMLRDAVGSPEFRKVLSDVLLTFFKSPEGKELFNGLIKGSS